MILYTVSFSQIFLQVHCQVLPDDGNSNAVDKKCPHASVNDEGRSAHKTQLHPSRRLSSRTEHS